MQKNNIVNNLIREIKKGEEISPFLFLSGNKELLTSTVENISIEILNHFGIPKTYLFKLEDNGEKIKISQIKDFLSSMSMSTPYKIQIFFIENISRMTIGAANSSLKRFEEPGKTNIIFLSENSESMILDTILSRVQIRYIGGKALNKRDEFYLNIIGSYIKEDSPELLSYFFRNKIEKEDYVKFLDNLIIYLSENMIYIDFLDEINDDINIILTNNVNAKYVADKWILKIK